MASRATRALQSRSSARVEAQSVSEFIAHVDAAHVGMSSSANFDLWFRGQKSASFLLESKCEWMHPGLGEDSVCTEFMIHAPGLTGGVPLPADAWELFALMQHYGVPTRLLDWSRAPLMALYFAVEPKSEYADEHAKVVVLNPVALNSVAIGKGEILSRVRPEARAYLPRRLQQASGEGSTKRLPAIAAAVEAPMSNARISAQRGCFTVAGSRRNSIPGARDALIQEILIPARAKPGVLAGLRRLGFSEDAVYQDLDSLARRIEREYFPEARRGLDPA